tara:strand:+ start:440 stop:991 length:552 start_codon:yes stop_codon:yes gene_type:complete
MKHTLTLLIFFISISKLFAQEPQRVISKDSYVHIYSYTPIEDIKAFLNDGLAILDLEKRELAYVLNIQSLTFKNALMQEHFNENYLESDMYPKSTLEGRLLGDIDFEKVGIYNVKVNGKLKMHGVERFINEPVLIRVLEDKSVTLESEFIVRPGDFNIKIPNLMITRIAEEIKVTVRSKFRIK